MDKIARICWNTHDWKRPSGSEGKSQVDSSYEKSMGYGHEEWLLDDSRIMPDGYHYGFLEPMNVGSGKHIGKTYNIHLFAITPKKQKVYIGCLHNAIGVDLKESKEIYQYYKKQGWRALRRNHVIHTIGCLTIAAQCTLGKGGTWDGILANLKNGWNSVCMFDDGSDGVTELQNRGVQPITVSELYDLAALAMQNPNFIHG